MKLMKIPRRPWTGRSQRASDQPTPPPPRPRRDRVLEDAIAANEIRVLFQPQFEVAGGRVRGVEALARWDGEPDPSSLFERAARANLSERLSRSVQRTAIRSAASWDGALGALRLSLNLLPEDLARPSYAQWLMAELSEAGLDPRRLTLEITEGSLLADVTAASERLTQLRAAGIRIAIDDFGTGYSSLLYLTTLPLDSLKIDRGLIAGLVGGERDRIVVRTMITMARELGLELVIEGVEESAQLDLLNEWGCDLYQGFLGARAMDVPALRELVAGLNR